MILSELLIETHHHGLGIIVRTVTEPYHAIGTVTVVEDECGNVDKVAINNQSETSLLANVPKGSIIAIKEPYYKYTSEDDLIICVDHPSDVILLESGDPMIPPELQLASEDSNKSPLDWRAAGDKAYLERNFSLALKQYVTSTFESHSPARCTAPRLLTKLLKLLGSTKDICLNRAKFQKRYTRKESRYKSCTQTIRRSRRGSPVFEVERTFGSQGILHCSESGI
jgi:hypothetical protein